MSGYGAGTPTALVSVGRQSSQVLVEQAAMAAQAATAATGAVIASS